MVKKDTNGIIHEYINISIIYLKEITISYETTKYYKNVAKCKNLKISLEIVTLCQICVILGAKKERKGKRRKE